MQKYFFFCLLQLCVFSYAADAASTNCVFCGVYPCGYYKTADCCGACDCSSVSCDAGYSVDANCICVKSGVGGGDLSKGQCEKGYYWSGSLSSGFCVRCPNGGTTHDVVYGDNGFIKLKVDITDCYIPAGQDVTDAAGTYSFTTDCAYTN